MIHSRMDILRHYAPHAMARVDAARAATKLAERQVLTQADAVTVPQAPAQKIDKAPPMQVDAQGRRFIPPYNKRTGKPIEIAARNPRPIDQIITKADKVNIRGKDHILKAGIAKIATEYRLSNESTAMDLQEIGSDVLATVKVTVTAPDGRITQRTASAAKSEGKDIQHLVATAETRAYGRAVLAAVGSGECSAEEMQSVDAGIMSREERGKLLEGAAEAAPQISSYVFKEIPSTSDHTKSYLIQGEPGSLSCSCPDYIHRRAARGEQCKHIRNFTQSNEHGVGDQQARLEG